MNALALGADIHRQGPVNAPRQRAAACLFLRFYEGLTAPEIASALRISPDAVYQGLHRALAQMRPATL